MNRYSVVLALCVGNLIGFAPLTRALDENTRVTNLQGQSGKHHFRARFVTGPFRRHENKAKLAGDKAFIAGKPEWNQDGSKS